MTTKWNAYSTIKLGEGTTEKDMYDLFGEAVSVYDENGNEIKGYLKRKYNKRNGWNNN